MHFKSAKDATTSGKGMTGFDGPESIAEMMDEQVKRTPGGSSVSLLYSALVSLSLEVSSDKRIFGYKSE